MIIQHSCSSLCFSWSGNEASNIAWCPNVPPPQMLLRPHPSIHIPTPHTPHTPLIPIFRALYCYTPGPA